MDFKAVTGRLLEAGVSLGEIARACGSSYSAVKEALMDDSSPAYRPPPEGWREAVGELARARGEALLDLAKDLDG